MPSLNLELNSDLYKILSKVCSELGLQKKALVMNLIKGFVKDLENKEDEKLLKIAEKRLKKYETGKLKTIKLKDAWQ